MPQGTIIYYAYELPKGSEGIQRDPKGRTMQNKCRTVDIGGLSLSKVLWPPGSHISSPPLAPVGWTQMARWQGLWKKIVCVCVCGSCVYAGRKQEGPTVNVIGDLAGVSDCEGEVPRKIVNFSLWRDGRSYQRKQTDLKIHAIIINDLAPTSSMLYDVACTSCSPVAGSQMPFFVTYFAVKGLPGLRNTWWGTLGKKLRWRTADDVRKKILRCCCWTKIRRIKIKRGWMKYVWNTYIYI